MEYTHLGRTGLRVSRLCLGTMNFGPETDEATSFAIMDKAHDVGVNFFDSANVYGRSKGRGATEEIVGRWLAQGGGRRERTVLATKLYGDMGDWPNEGRLSALNIRRACDASLRRLQTDYIDLYQMHRPDADTPIEETLAALDDLVRSGKVRYLGNSNFTGWQIAEADWVAKTEHLHRFVSAQNNYSLLERRVEHEVLPACDHFGLGFLPFFPLASGLLTGKYQRGEAAPEGTRLAGPRGAAALTDENFNRLERLAAYADAHGRTMLDLAFAWLLGHPPVTSVIAGATRPEQVRANAAAASWKMSLTEVAEVMELARA
jgi:aryl-alcohol dehydrogenase-like predicted oxidoreductase